jgi:hypothetical protein
MAMGQKPHAFAACVRRFADADIVTGADTRAVDGEASAADFAGDFADCVMTRFPFDRDSERGNAPPIRRVYEPNGSRSGNRHSGFSVPRGR